MAGSLRAAEQTILNGRQAGEVGVRGAARYTYRMGTASSRFLESAPRRRCIFSSCELALHWALRHLTCLSKLSRDDGAAQNAGCAWTRKRLRCLSLLRAWAGAYRRYSVFAGVLPCCLAVHWQTARCAGRRGPAGHALARGGQAEDDVRGGLAWRQTGRLPRITRRDGCALAARH